jgi:hypothetical protein
MKITWDGREWDYDDDHVTVRQAIAMQAAYGFTLSSWNDALKEIDARAWQCAAWLMHQRNGVIDAIEELDFDVLAFAETVIDAKLAVKAAKAREGGGEPDPTGTPPDSSRLLTG